MKGRGAISFYYFEDLMLKLDVEVEVWGNDGRYLIIWYIVILFGITKQIQVCIPYADLNPPHIN